MIASLRDAEQYIRLGNCRLVYFLLYFVFINYTCRQRRVTGDRVHIKNEVMIWDIRGYMSKD